MKEERKIKIIAKVVSFKEAEENDDLYFSKLTPEELLEVCFELRKLNYFSSGDLPKIEKVRNTFKKIEKYEA